MALSQAERQLYADSAQARSWDEEEAQALTEDEAGKAAFAEQCRVTRERRVEAFRPRLLNALDKMEAFFDGRKG